MALTNNLKKQIDQPVWEWCRLAPGTSSLVSSTCTADNSLYHVTFGRYIYYMQSGTTLATTTALTGFFRYDTISDSYQLLSQPQIALSAYTGMQFAGGQGYFANVLSSTANTITAAAITNKVLKSFDIRIIGGTGVGQQRIITDVSDPMIADNGTITAVTVTPQYYVTDSNKNWTINQWVGYQVRFVSAAGQSQVRKIMYNSSNTLYFADVAKFAEDQNAWAPIATVTNSALILIAVGSMYQIESSTITVDSPWLTQPDATSRFVVRAGGIWLLTSATNYALQYYDIVADTWYIKNGGSATSPVLAVGTDGTMVNSGENATAWDRGTALGAANDTTHLQDTTKSWTVNQWAGYYLRIFSGTGENQINKIISNTADTLAWSGAGTAPDATSRYFIESFEMGTLTSVGAHTQTGVSTGTINGNVFTAGTTTGSYYPGQILTGTGVQSSTIILSPSLACFTTSTVATVNFAVGNPSTMGITAGMVVTYVTGTAGVITAGTTVSSVTANTVVLSAAVTTALNAATLQFASVKILTACTTNTVLHSYVTTTSTAGLYTGAYLTFISGTGGVLASNSYVASVVDGTHFTLSAPPTTALNNAILQAQPYQTVIQNQLTGVPGGAGTYTIWPSQIVASTSITGTSIGTVVDSTKSWLPDRWNNYVIRIKSGTGAGQVRQITRTLPGAVVYTSAAGATNSGTLVTVGTTANLTVGMALNVASGTGEFAMNSYVTIINSGTTFTVNQALNVPLSNSAVVTGAPYNVLRVSPAWTTLPTAGSVYTIHGDSDKNYFSIAGNAPTFIHNIEADMVTVGRQLDFGAARGISAQYSDYLPVAVSTAVPVLPITSAIGYIVGTGVATLTAGNASNIATLTYTTAATASIFPVGSWITVSGMTTNTSYKGTWQVTNSGVGTVSFYSTTATGAMSGAGIIGQCNSVTLGGNLASGAYVALGAGTTVTISGAVPVAYNGTVTVTCGAGGTTGQTFGGYEATGVSGSSTSTFSVGSTAGLTVGAIPRVTAGTGSFPAGTVIVSFVANTSFTINTTATLSGATVTVTPSFAWAAGTVAGNMVTLGVAQKVPQNILSGSRSGSATASVLTAVANPTTFPVGSWITVSGCTPGSYNGVFQVTASTTAGSVSYVTSTSATDTITVVGTLGLATTTELITTVNNHGLSTGQSVTIKGDQGFSSATVNGASGAITVIAPSTIGNPSNQFTWIAPSPAGPMVVYPQSTTQLQDGSKNWVPNQWAGCIVTYNSIQLTTANVQPNILFSYILSNTPTTLIFAAALAAQPAQGVSRYVITAPATYAIGSMLGSQDGGLALGAAAGQTTSVLTDVTKSWVTPAAVAGITVTSVSGATCTVSTLIGLYPGMVAAVTLGNTSLPAGTVINSINPATPSVTLSNSFSANNNCTLTFLACCQSSGNTVTVNGYPLTNLAVGMNLAVTSTTNISAAVPTAGAFVANGGVNLTSVKVTSITSATALGGTFTISAVPTVPLVNATVQASFWFPNQWVNRRLRQVTGNVTYATSESVITSNTFNSLTVTTVFGTTHTHGVTGYAILQQPVRGAGTALLWAFGQSDPNRAGKYMYQARGGNLTGWDRINVTNDNWEFLTPTPNFETINTGAMFAYDGGDRIYFTVQATQRVYYLDVETMQIHPAGMYPYVAGTAIVGNRMEIFETVDNLRYLWLNRHSNMECFRQLLWY